MEIVIGLLGVSLVALPFVGLFIYSWRLIGLRDTLIALGIVALIGASIFAGIGMIVFALHLAGCY